MEWLLWLAPILILLLIYPFVTVGCGLDTQGLASPVPSSTRTLLFQFEEIPELGAIPITAITVQYQLSSGGTTISVSTAGTVSLQYTPSPTDPTKRFATGDVPKQMVQVPFAAGAPVACAVDVTLQRQEWNNNLPSITRAATATTIDDVIAWRLKYPVWPNAPLPADYDPAAFVLGLD
jgi:hypothetical protein